MGVRRGDNQLANRGGLPRLNITFRDRPCSWLTPADPPICAAAEVEFWQGTIAQIGAI
jgi:hypothetical protein